MTSEQVYCPACDGRGMVSAMSGSHLPHDATCDDCRGAGRVTPEAAEAIRARLREWMRRFNKMKGGAE